MKTEVDGKDRATTLKIKGLCVEMIALFSVRSVEESQGLISAKPPLRNKTKPKTKQNPQTTKPAKQKRPLKEIAFL